MSLRIPQLKAWHWVVLALFGAVALGAMVAAAVFLPDVPIRDMLDRVGARIQSLGAPVFFLALAVLPAFGAPVAPFYILSGSFGTGPAIVGCLVAIAANLALSYVVARWLLHPIANKLVAMTGRGIPVVQKEDRWLVALLFRITPGPPFFMQSYILALAGIPFGVYMLVSVPVAWAYALGMIVIGDSLMSGETGRLFFGISLFIAVVLFVMVVRSRLQRRARLAGLPAEVAESERDAPTP